MTIAFVATTSAYSTTATAVRGTTSIALTWPAVSAGQIAIIVAEGKLSATATWGTAPSGFTQLVNVTGGSGTEGADIGTTRLGVWYKILDGTETGTVTVSLTSGTQLTATLSTFSKTNTAWATPIAVTGAQSTTQVNVSVTGGTWASALATGDLVYIGYGSNTDATSSHSAMAVSQTSTTYGTVTGRSRLGGSDGNDGATFTWSVPVSSGGSTNAPTFTSTWAASSAGPMAFVRLRETTGTVTGAAVLSAQTSVTATGIAITTGVSVLSAQTSLTATGARTVNGAAAMSAETSLTANALLERLGAAILSAQTSFTAVGQNTVRAASVLSGQTSLVTSGRANVIGSAILSANTGFTSTGTRVVLGASALSGQTTLDSVGRQLASGAAVLSAQSTMAVDGIVGALPTEATMSAQTSLTVSGTVIKFASAVLSGQTSLVTSGRATVRGTAEFSAMGNLVAQGIRVVRGAVVLSGQTNLTAVGFVPEIITGQVSMSATLDIRRLQAKVKPPWVHRFIEFEKGGKVTTHGDHITMTKGNEGSSGISQGAEIARSKITSIEGS